MQNEGWHGHEHVCGKDKPFIFHKIPILSQKCQTLTNSCHLCMHYFKYRATTAKFTAVQHQSMLFQTKYTFRPWHVSHQVAEFYVCLAGITAGSHGFSWTLSITTLPCPHPWRPLHHALARAWHLRHATLSSLYNMLQGVTKSTVIHLFFFLFVSFIRCCIHLETPVLWLSFGFSWYQAHCQQHKTSLPWHGLCWLAVMFSTKAREVKQIRERVKHSL